MVLTTEKGDLGSIAFPRGMIMIWTQGANNIPSGWDICDGNNGTPDLRNKFLLGANTDPNVAAIFRTPGMGKLKNTTSIGSGEYYYPPFVTVAYIMKL